MFEYLVVTLFNFTNVVAIFGGAFIGMLIGALPGLGATIAIVMLLPITYAMAPVSGILLLLSTYQAAEYGGSISSIILGIPGTPAAVATVIDGNALAKRNSPGKALGYSLTASTIGGIFGALVLIFFTEPLSAVALKLADPEYFIIAAIGLIAAASIGSKDTIKSLISLVLGLIVATIGLDMFSGLPRFTMGMLELTDGVQLVPVLMGMYAITEILSMVTESLNTRFATDNKGMNVSISFKEFREVTKPIGVGCMIGTVIGCLPGLGPPTATWLTYTVSKKMSKHPETFGQGNPEGIAGPEASNNAAVGGALVPLLLLGIAGSATMAVIAGAFIIHGVAPGPRLFVNNRELVNGIIYGFLFTTIAMYIVGRLLTPIFARCLKVPNYFLAPVILVLSIVGTYASRGSVFDIWIALGLGVITFFIKKLEFSLPSFTLAFVLSPLIEKSLRRTLLISGGSYKIFLERPVSLCIIVCTILIAAFIMIKSQIKKKNFLESSN